MATVRRWPSPSRNDIQLQFSSIDLGIRGNYFPWVNEISYDMTLDPGEARGTSPYPMGVTLGEIKANGSLTIHRIYREQFLNFVEQNQKGFMQQFFPVQVTVQEFGWSQTETDEFDARIVGMSHEFTAGNNVLQSKFPLYIPGLIKANGHQPTDGIVI